jgi:hypothetical protein
MIKKMKAPRNPGDESEAGVEEQGAVDSGAQPQDSPTNVPGQEKQPSSIAEGQYDFNATHGG